MKLFARVSGRLQPTAEAKAIFPEIDAIFGRVDAVNALTQDLVGGRLGTLSVAAAFPIANGYLAKAVATFVVERPNVRVALQSLTSPQVLDRVVHREVELGIAYEPVVSSEVETKVLMRTGIACVMAAGHPLARRKEVAVRDLEPYSIITYLPQALSRIYVDRALSAAGIVPNIVAQVSLSLTGIMLARHGAGVALVEPLAGGVDGPARRRDAAAQAAHRRQNPADPAQDGAAIENHERIRRSSRPGDRRRADPIDRLMETGQIVIGQL